MAIKKYKPTTPGRRGMTVTDYSVLSKVEPERSLLEPKKKHAGRNNTGKITVRHHGGGNRVKYRVIDFKRNKFDVPATVKTLEYDPNRSAFIALIEYEDGVKSYILAPDGLKVGDLITVTCTATGDDGHLQIANPDGWVAFDINSSTDLAASDMAQTFSYEIPDVATLELIQLNGILVRGRNIFQDGYCLRVFLLGRKAPCQGSLIDRAVFGIDSQKRIAIGRCRPGIFILLFGRKGIFRDQIIDGTI